MKGLWAFHIFPQLPLGAKELWAWALGLGPWALGLGLGPWALGFRISGNLRALGLGPWALGLSFRPGNNSQAFRPSCMFGHA